VLSDGDGVDELGVTFLTLEIIYFPLGHDITFKEQKILDFSEFSISTYTKKKIIVDFLIKIIKNKTNNQVAKRMLKFAMNSTMAHNKNLEKKKVKK